MTGISPAGFPHSDICGSQDICSLPQLFAAYHVLHRLLVPRHPPYALLRLIIVICSRIFRFLKWSLLSVEAPRSHRSPDSFAAPFEIDLFSRTEIFISLMSLSVRSGFPDLFLEFSRLSVSFSTDFFFVRYAIFKVPSVQRVAEGLGKSSFETCLMEIMRFELMTPCLQGRCSPN